MTAMGGTGDVRAFAAALAAATSRLDAMADAAGRATQGGDSVGGSSRGGRSSDGVSAASIAKIVAGLGAGQVASETAGAVGTRGMDAMAGALETAIMRALSHLPGIGAVFGEALEGRGNVRDRIMKVMGPIAEAGGKYDPDLAASLLQVESARMRRGRTAAKATEDLMDTDHARQQTEGEGAGAWRWLGGEVVKTVGGWLEDIGINVD